MLIKEKMGFLTKLIKLNAATLAGGAGLTAYYYPELRQNPKQFCLALLRGGRIGATGIMMAGDYLTAKEICSQTHEKAAGRMYECFKKNGGPYIKLGQMMGQLDNLVPHEYIVAFEPMLMQAPKTGI